MSNLFKLNSADIAHAVSVAVAVAILGGLQQMLTAHGFDFSSYDWGFIFQLAVTAVLGSLGVALGTTRNGNVLGLAKVK